MDTSKESGHIPQEILNKSEEVIKKLLPDKSKNTYKNAYSNFKTWQMTNNTTSSTEAVMLVYFDEIAKKYKSSSLWAIYSMLKTMINVNENVDIGEHRKLTTYLKSLSKGFVAKKSNILSANEVQKFLTNANDNEYLGIKVSGVLTSLTRFTYLNIHTSFILRLYCQTN